MSEMMATANAKSIEQIKSILSRQKEVYKIPYDCLLYTSRCVQETGSVLVAVCWKVFCKSRNA